MGNNLGDTKLIGGFCGSTYENNGIRSYGQTISRSLTTWIIALRTLHAEIRSCFAPSNDRHRIVISAYFHTSTRCEPNHPHHTVLAQRESYAMGCTHSSRQASLVEMNSPADAVSRRAALKAQEQQAIQEELRQYKAEAKTPMKNTMGRQLVTSSMGGMGL